MIFVTGVEDAGTRLDVFLAQAAGKLSRSGVQNLNRRGGIRVNGSPEKSGYRLRSGDRIELDMPEAPPGGPEAEEIPLEVLYEDAHLVVIDKPAGMVVHPGAGNRRSTLVNALLARFPDLSGVGGIGRPGIVHRLDKLTSGLIVVARTDEACQRLTRSFADRRVHKTYRAAVHGVLSDDAGTIDLGIGRHPRIRTRMAARADRGRSARSEYRVLERGRCFSLLEVVILTGRTHQIRVHLSAIGHPVVGDATYGQTLHRAFLRRYPEPGRYFLHAARISLPHPATGETVAFEAPLPAELASLWERLKADR
jgi:23S rRNA pseudouridine1911/1915/1917 synthase